MDRTTTFPPASPFHLTSAEQAVAAALITCQQTLGTVRDRHTFDENTRALAAARALIDQVAELVAALQAMPDQDGAA